MQHTNRSPKPLPRGLKQVLEIVSARSLDNVAVYYDATEPAQLNAFGLARGRDIYLAKGCEHLLAHEAWHIVQQAQGRVRAHQFINGESVNTNRLLELEAHIAGSICGAIGRFLQRSPKLMDWLEKSFGNWRKHDSSLPCTDGHQPVVQRALRKIVKGSEEPRKIRLLVVKDIEQPPKDGVQEVYAFDENDRVSALFEELDVVAVKLAVEEKPLVPSSPLTSQKSMAKKRTNFSLINCNWASPLLPGGRYVVQQRPTFSSAWFGGKPDQQVLAETLVRNFSTLVRQVLREKDKQSEEIQTMVVGNSIIISANYADEIELLAEDSKALSKYKCNELVNQIINAYKSLLKKPKQPERPLTEDELDVITRYFAAKTDNVAYAKTAQQLSKIEAPLIIVGGEGSRSEKKAQKDKYQALHVEQNILLAYINYLLSCTDLTATHSLVLGGYKSACGSCARVLEIIRIVLETYTRKRCVMGIEGKLNVEFNGGRSKSLVALPETIGSELQDLLDRCEHNSNRKRMRNAFDQAFALLKLRAGHGGPHDSSQEIRQSSEKVELTEPAVSAWLNEHNSENIANSSENLARLIALVRLLSGHSLADAYNALVQDDKSSEAPSYDRYNCLITAVNGGNQASLADIIEIRDLVLGANDIPIGEQLPDDYEVLQIIVSRLGIRNRHYRIESAAGNRYFEVDANGQVTMYGLTPPAQGTAIYRIRHDGGDIGHFAFIGLGQE